MMSLFALEVMLCCYPPNYFKLEYHIIQNLLKLQLISCSSAAYNKLYHSLSNRTNN